MNDTKSRENTYHASCAMVDQKQQALNAAAEKATNLKKSYLNTMVLAASESEKLRRKKDKMVRLIWLGIALVIALISLVFLGGGGFLGVALGLGCITILIDSGKSDKRDVDYAYRKEFFTKYFASLPMDAHFKWKEVEVSTKPQEQPQEQNQSQTTTK